MKFDATGFVFALLAGFASIAISHRMRAWSRFQTWERLLFCSTALGMGYFVILRLPLFEPTSFALWLAHEVRRAVPFPYSPSWVAAIGLGVFVGMVSRRMTNRLDADSAAIKADGSELLTLFALAAERRHLVCLDLKNGKFYIGYIVGGVSSSDRSYVRVFASSSGYRDKANMTFRFTTSYRAPFAALKARLEEEPHGELLSEALGHVIPIDQIASAYLFDEITYDLFKGENPLTDGLTDTST